MVEFKESTGDVRKDTELLSNVEGLEWMGDLLDRDDVDWVAVQEIHDQWSKSDGGLGAGGMLIVSLIASAVTAGAASGLAAACMGLQVGAKGALMTAAGVAVKATGQLAMHAALTAGFTSIGTQAILALGNAAAGGDLGQGLSSIVSSQGLKSLTTAMLSAGLTSAALSNLDKLSETADVLQDADKFYANLADKLQSSVINAGVNTGVGTAVNGGDLGENLVANLRGAAVSTLGAQGANAIGVAYRDGDLNLASRYIAHAALGGAMDVALGGDGLSGAVGAVAGEASADVFVATYVNTKLSDPNAFATPQEFQEEMAQLEAYGVDVARLGAGMAAAAIGGDMDIATQTGANAAENNAVFCLAIAAVITTLEVADKAITAYDAWRLAQALNEGDTEAAAEIGAELSIGLATEAIPGNKVALALAESLDGLGLVALGSKTVGKVGDNAISFVNRTGNLTGAEKAFIDSRKLTEYALNPNHSVGKNKAKVFDSALGFNQSNSSTLMKQLQEGVKNNQAVAGKVDEYGSRFTVDIPVTGPKGEAVVRTGWIY